MRASKSARKVTEAFREVYANEPAVVGDTRAKFGAKRAQRQKVAIALSKARRAGAKAPQGPNPMSPGWRLVQGDLRKGYRSV